MPDSDYGPNRSLAPAAAPPVRWRLARAFLVPPFLVPVGLSLVLLLFLLIRGPA